ncbi:V-set and transmembrane domain-containing protein 1-like isoform X2 [Prionailurus viverrinus]|uniref:V-set and transmembrane domain-containing protein 1-like isoform X2 n=1 Tax=Prionailurus viverrinus TaxID=61388 RepID=UPI001FF401DB|nr:V-set and transmembrane domain-containing protein 1-like isoform X2 [Prionailurus viverrinus]
MITEFLSLLCLGLSLGFEVEKKNDDRNKRRAPPGGKVTRSIIAATCSCLSILLLFLSVFLINRCTQHDLSHEESTKRTSHSKLSQQEAMDSSDLERTSVSAERPPGSELC